MMRILMIFLLACTGAFGQWDPDGIYIGNGSVSFSMCQDGSGGIYLGWEQGNPNYFDIYVQHVDSAGYKLFGEYGLNLTPGIGDNHGECHNRTESCRMAYRLQSILEKGVRSDTVPT